MSCDYVTVVYPPNYITLGGRSLIFFNGPIQGAPPWAALCENYMRQHAKRPFVIANPHRPHVRIKGEFTEAMFNEQIDWEHFHRTFVHNNQYSVNMFWCAKEAEHFCNRPYAKTTRGELGMSLMLRSLRIRGRPANLVVGFDPEFDDNLKHEGRHRFWERMIGHLAPETPVCRTIEETCQAALDMINA